MASAQALAAAPRIRPRQAALAAAIFTASACGAGPYGYSRVYSPLAEEREAAQGSEAYDAVMAQRQPDVWHDRTISVFGVVTASERMADGHTALALSVRKLRARNLCEENVASSCRVTVGDLETARLKARVRLGPDSKRPVREGSLVRVIGRLQLAGAGTQDGAWLETVYYRHWPATEYVTDAARDYMRR